MSDANPPDGHPCGSCPARGQEHLERLGVNMDRWDHVVALAGNPNTGKSTIFNALTGLRQHTGNWPGKTIARAEGGFSYGDRQYKLVDLPGTYSLLSASPDEEVARDFILFGRPDVTVVVVDATRLERNLNLVLQILQITPRVVVCLNLIDEAKAHGLTVDERGLARDLGVPVVPTAARFGRGILALLDEVHQMALGETVGKPHRLSYDVPGLREAVAALSRDVTRVFPGVPNSEWIALRLLGGDPSLAEAVADGTLGELAEDHGSDILDAGNPPLEVAP